MVERTALPVPGNCQDRGMTLRDYFAARAMASLVASAGFISSDDHAMWRKLAERSYAAADGMLRARAQGETTNG